MVRQGHDSNYYYPNKHSLRKFRYDSTTTHNGFTILDATQLMTQNGYLKFDSNRPTTQKAAIKYSLKSTHELESTHDPKTQEY